MASLTNFFPSSNCKYTYITGKTAHAKTLFSNADPEHRLHKYLQKWQSSVGHHSSRLRDAPIVINNYKVTDNSLFSKFIIWVLIKLSSFLMNYHFTNYYFYSDLIVMYVWYGLYQYLIQSLVANIKHQLINQSINTTQSRKVCLIGMLVKFCNRSFDLEGVNWAIQFHQHMLYICINLIFNVNLMVSLHVLR